LVAVGTYEGKIYLCPVQQLIGGDTVLEECPVLEGHEGGIGTLEFAFDGATLGSASVDYTAKLWDFRSRQCLKTLRGHKLPVLALAFGRDRDAVATGSWDETIRLWRRDTGEPLAELRIDRLYERMNIHDVAGITDAQRATLMALGAIDSDVQQEGVHTKSHSARQTPTVQIVGRELGRLQTEEGMAPSAGGQIFINIGGIQMSRDKIKVTGGQIGAVGQGAHADNPTFHQVWNQIASQVDLAALGGELASLRQALKDKAKSAEENSAVGAVAAAETAAKKGDGPSVLERLKNAGEWALKVALEIGLPYAVKAIKAAIGLSVD
jgi:hypothetical protein